MHDLYKYMIFFSIYNRKMELAVTTKVSMLTKFSSAENKQTIDHTKEPSNRVRYIVMIFFTGTLIFHIGSMYNDFILYKTAAQINVTDNDVTEVTVTACPHLPHSMEGMAREGLTTNDVQCYETYGTLSCDFDPLTSQWMSNYSTIDGNRTLDSVWTTTELNATTFFKSFTDFDSWSSMRTSRNKCFTKNFLSTSFTSSVLMPIRAPITYYNCSELVKDQSCIFRLVTTLQQVILRISAGSNIPLIIKSGGLLTWTIKPNWFCTYSKPCTKDIILNAYHRNLISTPVRPCSNEKSYSQDKCKENCTLAEVSNRLSCSLPYVNSSHPACTVSDFRNNDGISVKSLDYNKQCMAKCLPDCTKTFLSATTRDILNQKQVSKKFINRCQDNIIKI